MLDLDETLFVEHKGAEPEFQLAKAVASFANQLGGWVLVNVSGGKPIGDLPDWVTAAASPVDAVRDRLEGRIRPLPPFEARTLDVGRGEVLVIRVYESSDTPHVLEDGAIYVRGVATDRKYRPVPIESQHMLLELVNRRDRSRERAGTLLAPSIAALPLANGALGLGFAPIAGGGLVVAPGEPAIFVRLVPHTLPARFVGWARSRDALDAATSALAALSGSKGGSSPVPHGQGFVLARSLTDDHAPVTEAGRGLGIQAKLVVDAAGVVGASVFYRKRNDHEFTDPHSLANVAELYLAPLIKAPVDVLLAGEILGRATCHVWIRGVSGVIRIEHDGTMIGSPPGPVPFEEELTLPLVTNELEGLAARAVRAFGREGGLEAFED